ncbi:hypothetical protein Tco_0058095 [Tanacetum coccineum]
MHTPRDDSLLGTMRFISRHEDAQIYGAILPKAMANQAMLESVAYKTYYAIASGAEPPKSKKPKMKYDSGISSEETPSKKKPTKAKKYVPSKKKPASKPKPTKKKVPVKADRGKALNVLSEVALSKADQLREATKQSKKDFHILQENGSGDGTNLESGVSNEQHRKTSGADEGTGTKPGVPNVPKYDSESDKESWDDSEKEDDDNEDDTEDDKGYDASDGNDDDDNDDNGGDDDDDNDANDDDNQEDDDNNDDKEETDKEKVADEVTKELYKDVNVNLGNEDVDMTDADQGGSGQQNVSQESGFKQVEEDAHVTLTSVLDTQKTDKPVQSSSVSSDFTSKLLNLENPSLADNEIDSLMDTTVRHEEPGNCKDEAQAEKKDYIELVDTLIRAILKEEVNTQLPQILPQAVSDFATPMIEKNVTESLEAAVLARYSSQPKYTYEAAASLLEFELTKILIDKMEKNKSYNKADYKRELYDRSRDDRDKDQDPSAGSDQGTKKGSKARKLSHPEIQEEPSHTVDESGVQQNQDIDTSNDGEQPTNKEVSKADWFKKPERPPTPNSDLNKRQHVDFRPPQNWIN